MRFPLGFAKVEVRRAQLSRSGLSGRVSLGPDRALLITKLASLNFARYGWGWWEYGIIGPRSSPDCIVGPRSGPDCTIGPRLLCRLRLRRDWVVILSFALAASLGKPAVRWVGGCGAIEGIA